MLISHDSKARCWAIFALALLPIQALGQEANSPEDVQKLCSTLGKTAELILDLRESGMPLSRVLELTTTSEPEMAKVAREMVLAAYDLPRFSTPAMKERQSQDFRNQVELMCFRSQGG